MYVHEDLMLSLFRFAMIFLAILRRKTCTMTFKMPEAGFLAKDADIRDLLSMLAKMIDVKNSDARPSQLHYIERQP